jgi:hypothetical protein
MLLIFRRLKVRTPNYVTRVSGIDARHSYLIAIVGSSVGRAAPP